MKNVGHTLASIRQRYGFSQKTIADKIGVSLDLVASIEKGRRQPSVPTLEKFEELFGIPNGVIAYLSSDLEAIKRSSKALAPLVDSTASAMWAAIDARATAK